MGAKPSKKKTENTFKANIIILAIFKVQHLKIGCIISLYKCLAFVARPVKVLNDRKKKSKYDKNHSESEKENTKKNIK